MTNGPAIKERPRRPSEEVATAATGTNSGLPPRAAAALSYAAWWLTGGLFLLIEPTHPLVRFHARQAFVGFGLIWIVGALAWGMSFATAFVSTWLSRVVTLVAQGFWGAALVVWLICVVKAWRGERWAIPGLPRRAQAVLERP